MRRSVSIVAIAGGLLLALFAALLEWVVAPALAVLPSDTNTTRTYQGTASTLLNPAALLTGGQVLLQNVPITVTHSDKVLATSGDNALVSDVRTVRTGQTAVATLPERYAVQRATMQRGTGFSNVTRQTGLTFNWPIRTEQRDYVGWVADTGSTTPLRYTGTATRAGVSTYVFTTSTQPKPITEAGQLAQLPTALPKATFVRLIATLPLTAAQQAQAKAILPSLPDPVRLAYTYQVTATYWVAPASGIVVDLRQHEIRTAQLLMGATAVPITPVMDITFTSTPATLAAAAHDATSNGGQVTLLYVTLPLILGVAGLVSLLGGLIALSVRRPRPPTARHAPRELTPAG